MADAILVWLDMLDQPTLGMLRMSFFWKVLRPLICTDFCVHSQAQDGLVDQLCRAGGVGHRAYSCRPLSARRRQAHCLTCKLPARGG